MRRALAWAVWLALWPLARAAQALDDLHLGQEDNQ